MKNIKVSRKLFVSFFIVIAFSIIVGCVGIFGMYQINEADNDLYFNNYLPTVMAGDISQTVVSQRMCMRDFVIYDVNKNSEIFSKSEKNMDELKEKMKQLFSEYEVTIINPDDQELFDEFVKVYNNQWLPFIDEVHEYGVANMSAEAQAALTAGASVASTMDELTTDLQQINLSDGETSINKNTDLFNFMAIVEVIILIFAITVATLFGTYISKLISKPLVTLTEFMEKASSKGDIMLTQEEEVAVGEYSKVRDEVGQCIKSTVAFIKRLHNISDVLQAVANKDLTSELSLLSEQDSMGVSLNKMMDNLNGMFDEINTATAQVATGSRQVAEGSQALAQGSTEQASAVEQLSSSISEIADKTNDNATMADKASNLANNIKHNAEKGSQQMGEMMGAVKEINDASQSINKVIKVIDDIAFQTNILALNAAVEAARAGQHGKGFAVVAEEVRNLAAKSAEAAKDTGNLIVNSMEKAELGARIADDTAASFKEIVSGIKESTQLVSDIAKSSKEQSVGISQINKGIDQVAQVVQQNSATAEESAASSEEMSSQSDMLQSLVAQFKIKSNNNFARTMSPVMPSKTSNNLYALEDNYGKY